jgi:RNA polymerase sigma-70 factor (ECF subfamily)
MDQHHESEIAEGLCAGDVDAWRRLYDAQAEAVWRLVARMMATDPTAVGDVVQESFLEAARSARGFDPQRGPIRAWLFGIARRQVALYFRRKHRQSVATADVSSDAEDKTAVDTSPGPAERMEAVELAQQVRATLTRLPTDYELLLTAKYIQGDTVSQIAVAECATQEGTRSKLARARRAFRQMFTKHFPRSKEYSS